MLALDNSGSVNSIDVDCTALDEGGVHGVCWSIHPQGNVPLKGSIPRGGYEPSEREWSHCVFWSFRGLAIHDGSIGVIIQDIVVLSLDLK